jgi:hypothetical protein
MCSYNSIDGREFAAALHYGEHRTQLTWSRFHELHVLLLEELNEALAIAGALGMDAPNPADFDTRPVASF